MQTREAIALAESQGLDLVEIQAQQRPPLCKILDWGKFRFEEQKKERQSRKNQHEIVTKEVQLKPVIADHDWDLKMRRAEEFLKDQHRVQLVLRFRGREITHPEIGRALIQRSIARLAEVGTPAQSPSMDGKLLQVTLLPGKAKPGRAAETQAPRPPRSATSVTTSAAPSAIRVEPEPPQASGAV